MWRCKRAGASAAVLLAGLAAGSAAAQNAAPPAAPQAAPKPGGILRVELIDNPPSASPLEEVTVSVAFPFSAIFNNLVRYDPQVRQNSLNAIVPDLAESWAWSDEGRKLTFKLHSGVKWHDGKPFSAKDVQCTFDMLMGKSQQKLRKNPRDNWWDNVESITNDGVAEIVFTLKRPQPSVLALLAAGWSVIYPCHATPAEMRTKPIGTGPFKLVEFRPNTSITLARNPDYFKPGLPYLDGIEYKIIPSRATRMLAFTAGEFDLTFPSDISVPLLKDVKAQAPTAQCTMRPQNITANLLLNRDVPPFDNADLRRALALSLDRKAFIDILTEGEGLIGGAMLPPPAGLWGLPPEQQAGLPGYGDVARSREEGRALMRKLGYGPDKRLALKVITRNTPSYRDPAVILIDQLKEVYIDAELETLETSVYLNRTAKKDYSIAANTTGSSLDDPDQHLYENYSCGSARNYTNYCNKELEALFDRQSAETDVEKRRRLVWEIDRKLQEDVARPIFYHPPAAVCMGAKVRGLTIQVNSIYNGWRFEEVWFDG